MAAISTLSSNWWEVAEIGLDTLDWYGFCFFGSGCQEGGEDLVTCGQKYRLVQLEEADR